MAWIESHTGLKRHRKLIELSKELKMKPVQVMGYLHSLWHEALEQQEDGDLSSWSDDFIAESSSFEGKSSQWVKALQKHKWMDGKFLHDWLDYAGRYLTGKYRTANPDRLIKIFEKHGRIPPKVGKQSDFSPTKDGQPDLTRPNPPNLTKPVTEKQAPMRGEVNSNRCSYDTFGAKCPEQREERALYCREHIEKLKDRKERRSGGFQQVGELQ